MHRHDKDSPIDAMGKILQGIAPGAENRTGDTYINAIRNEFMTFDGTITVPRIPVKELDMATSLDLVRDLVPFIPEFLRDHTVLEKRNPPAEQHHIHLVRKLRGKVMDFTHIFKLDFKFGGDTSTIIERGTSDWYPSYTTGRIYYKSRLIPENSVHRHESTALIRPIRIRDANEVESDQFFHTFAIFEDLNERELTRELLGKIDGEIFPVSPEIYPFIVYDYFSACLNILYPDGAALTEAVRIYEPLFIYIYSRFRNIRGLINMNSVMDQFSEELTTDGQDLAMTDAFREQLKNYFSRFSISRDDDMMVRGWWKFGIAP
ncbi:MAG: hypothetical protein CVV44_11825 [Spirochaetae bacterium HGW-Spirochaetae-1]|jgi:hypothetical protein|nr:MAG: hypothetical protein CVV44_11825 [Spirochaetae bacterium HGW-Spirochaetae-1]